MTWVKMCGTTSVTDVAVCVRAGADALGFVVEFPLEVPWNLTRDRAATLLETVPDGVEKVLVVGDDLEQVVDLARLLRPDAVQLHADEPPEATRAIVRALHPLGIRVIKAVRFSVETGQVAGRWAGDRTPVEWARSLVADGVDVLLVDSVSRTRPAGTGQQVDRTTARLVREGVDVPVVLAGGLMPDNVAAAIADVGPWGVDVISGVEAERGRKDPDKVAAFVRAAKGLSPRRADCAPE